MINIFKYSHWLEWVFPPRCGLCAKPLPPSGIICVECRNELPWNLQYCRRCALPIFTGMECGGCVIKPPAFQRCVSPFLYEPPISTFIIQLKFQQQLRYARILGLLLIEALEKEPRDWPECLIPVPLHIKRLRKRGFNQAVEIAKPLSRHFKLPILYDECYRQKNTFPQSRLSARARSRNLRGAFSVRKKINFTHVALIDDVVTTGQTVRAFSQMLQAEGVSKIEIWTCARAI